MNDSLTPTPYLVGAVARLTEDIFELTIKSFATRVKELLREG